MRLRTDGASGHWRTTGRAFVHAVERVGDGPAAVVRFAGSHSQDALLKVAPWRPRRSIMGLRQVLDVDSRHDVPGDMHHVVSQLQPLIKKPLGPHDGRDTSGDKHDGCPQKAMSWPRL